MRRAKYAIIVIALVLSAGILIHFIRRSHSAATIIGVVRPTEVRVQPEVDGKIVSIAVRTGSQVHAGDVLARLSAIELTAQMDQARAALASAIATCNDVYAGVPREQVASLKNEIAKADARLEYAQAELSRTNTLARQSFESQQALDQAENTVASARADLLEAEANYDAAVAGPTAVADAKVWAATAAVAVLERRLDKMILRAPADGVVSVIAAEVGENVRAGHTILIVEKTGKQWFSFKVREDHLGGLTVGKTVSVMRNNADDAIKSVVTELRPLEVFATRKAGWFIGDRHRNTLLLRLDPQGASASLEPGTTVWIDR